MQRQHLGASGDARVVAQRVVQLGDVVPSGEEHQHRPLAQVSLRVWRSPRRVCSDAACALATRPTAAAFATFTRSTAVLGQRRGTQEQQQTPPRRRVAARRRAGPHLADVLHHALHHLQVDHLAGPVAQGGLRARAVLLVVLLQLLLELLRGQLLGSLRLRLGPAALIRLTTLPGEGADTSGKMTRKRRHWRRRRARRYPVAAALGGVARQLLGRRAHVARHLQHVLQPVLLRARASAAQARVRRGARQAGAATAERGACGGRRGRGSTLTGKVKPGMCAVGQPPKYWLKSSALSVADMSTSRRSRRLASSSCAANRRVERAASSSSAVAAAAAAAATLALGGAP
eukprot:scaffold2440_cov294-Prasinococcus_capsulatus_cf.AAC.2